MADSQTHAPHARQGLFVFKKKQLYHCQQLFIFILYCLKQGHYLLIVTNTYCYIYNKNCWELCCSVYVQPCFHGVDRLLMARSGGKTG